MDNKPVLYLHGFASSGQGTKAQFFGERFETLTDIGYHAFEFTPTPKDFEYMTITGSINRLRQYLLEHRHEKVSFIGSSLGALIGLHYAHRYGGVENMLLLAPALAHRMGRRSEAELQQWESEGVMKVYHYAFQQKIPLRYDYRLDALQYTEPVPPPIPLMIIHGQNDDIVPIDYSREYAANFPNQVQLIEVDSDHRLNDQLVFIWEQAKPFLVGCWLEFPS